MAEARKSAAPGRETRGARKDHQDERSPTILPRKAALELVERYGWHVFRVQVTHNEAACGGAASCKHVQPQKQWRETSSNDPEVIASWDWSRYNAYGIDCGASGIVGVDVDPGASWPFQSDCQFSTGRGAHFIYEDLIGEVGNRAALAPWGVDVRGEGGFLIGPGSYHPHGEYVIEKGGDPSPAPRELYDTLDRQKSTQSAHMSPLEPLDALDRLEGVYRRMSEAQVGERNNTLNVMAGAAAGLWVRLRPEDQTGELDEDRIKQRLLESVPDLDDEAEARATIESGWAHGLDNPLGDDTQASRAEQINEIFSSSDVLAHIRQYAHGSGRGAMLMLSSVLARVLAEVPPSVVLPGAEDGAILNRASLNLGFAFVGRSGAGKSQVSKGSAKLLGIDQRHIQFPVGSGEGLIESYLTDEKVVDDKGRLVKTGQKVLIDDPRRLFNINEIEQLAQLGSRAGATLGSHLREMLMGDDTGTTNADPSRSRKLDEGTYRTVVTVSVQPELSGALLDGQNAGLPQRFVWVRVVDPTQPTPDEMPQLPEEPLNFRLPPFDFTDDDQFVIDYPQHVKEKVRWDHHRAQQDDADDREAHLNLTRLKVAAALALLHGELSISDYWWEVSGLIIDESERVQAECRAVLARAAQEASTAYATRQARAHDVAQSVVIDDNLRKAVEQTMTNLRRVARKAGSSGPFKWTEVRPSSKYRRWESATEDIVSEMRHRANVRVEESVARSGQTTYSFWLE